MLPSLLERCSTFSCRWNVEISIYIEVSKLLIIVGELSGLSALHARSGVLDLGMRHGAAMPIQSQLRHCNLNRNRFGLSPGSYAAAGLLALSKSRPSRGPPSSQPLKPSSCAWFGTRSSTDRSRRPTGNSDPGALKDTSSANKFYQHEKTTVLRGSVR